MLLAQFLLNRFLFHISSEIDYFKKRQKNGNNGVKSSISRQKLRQRHMLPRIILSVLFATYMRCKTSCYIFFPLSSSFSLLTLNLLLHYYLPSSSIIADIKWYHRRTNIEIYNIFVWLVVLQIYIGCGCICVNRLSAVDKIRHVFNVLDTFFIRILSAYMLVNFAWILEA